MKFNIQLILFFILIFNVVNAQQYSLKITGKDSITTPIIYGINYIEKHPSEKSVKNEVVFFTKKLDSLGYLNHHFEVFKKDTLFSYVLDLGVKIDTAVITYNTIDSALIESISNSFSKQQFSIPFTEISSWLSKIVAYYENKGFSFTTAKLENISTKNNKLYATLKVDKTKKRSIDKIKVVGYKKFPLKFLRNNFSSKKNISFTRKKIKQLENELNTLDFITQVKPPEVLFREDSTIVYIYIKKRLNNTADGILGFSNSKTKKLKLTGVLNLNLQNLFNKGALYQVNWNSISNVNTSLNIQTHHPYIFNTNLNFNNNFKIFKQHKSFTNSIFKSSIDYRLNKNLFLGLNYHTEQSSTLNYTTISSANYSKSLLGIHLASALRLINKKHVIKLSGDINFGRRKTDTKINQNIIDLLAIYTYNINKQNYLIVKNQFKQLKSEDILTNEQFRIGGINSIRGFNEESIFTPKYNLANIEYHYTTQNKLTLFALLDYAFLKPLNSSKKQDVLGFGIGSKIKANSNSILTLIYALGKSNKENVELRNSKLHLKFQLNL
ncbi:MAG TPA: hypothetical protein VJ970_02040 [Flavobacteriaceae bacterium]|nr:hypothetical protein [Flavobacteriaceae bacterium]